MRVSFSSFGFASMIGLALASPLPAQERLGADADVADLPRLSAETIRTLDRAGYLSPKFKATLRREIEVCQALAATAEETRRLQQALPDLQVKSTAAAARAAALEKEWSREQEREAKKYGLWQAALVDPAGSAATQLALSRSYLWAYPQTPHREEIESKIAQLQTKLQAQAEDARLAEIRHQAEQAALLLRMKARTLTLDEWRVFLADLSQEQVVGYLGYPLQADASYWVYGGGWVTDPLTQRRANLQISFNGTRVQTTTTAPYVP